ncbi:MAG: hypothetical protein JSS65_04390 [Armatimonadetes bacterium]|nr:hypothetical protein [Armatimonadota bacterium]
MAKKTWRQKYDNGHDPEVVVLDKPGMGLVPGQKLLISSPSEIDGLLRSVPIGQTTSVAELRNSLATRHGADGTCPLTTGIFLRIIAEVALEELAAGKGVDEVAPFWRVVDPKSPLAKKLSCGPEWIRTQRDAETRP